MIKTHSSELNAPDGNQANRQMRPQLVSKALSPAWLSMGSTVNSCFLPSFASWNLQQSRSTTTEREHAPKPGSRPLSGVERKRHSIKRYLEYAGSAELPRAGPSRQAPIEERRLQALPSESEIRPNAPTREEWASVLMDDRTTLQVVVNFMDRCEVQSDLKRDQREYQWPMWFLQKALTKVADVQSLLRFLPYTVVELDRVSPGRQVDILHALVRVMAPFNMLAPLLHLVDRYLGQQASGSSLSPSRSLPTDRLIKAITLFGTPPPITSIETGITSSLSDQHRAVISNCILRILLYNLSQPSAQHSIPTDIFPTLFNSAVLTPTLRRILLKEVKQRNVKLSNHQWRTALASAVRERDVDGARKIWLELYAKAITASTSPVDLEEKQMLGVLMLAWAEGSYEAITRVASDLNLVSDFEESEALQGPMEHTHKPSHADPARYARSMIATRASQNGRVNSEDLIGILNRTPAHQLDRRTLTSLMRGLNLRGDYERASQLWEAMVAREHRRWETGSTIPEVDHVAITVAVDTLASQGKLDEAVTLADSWAQRPGRKSRGGKHDATRALPLDTQAANVLLQACGTARKASVAFRIWEAMLPRWGVYHDGISLALLLKAANVEQRSSGGQKGLLAESRELLSEGFRDFSSSFRLSKAMDVEAYEAYEANGFAKGPVSVLLDPAEASYNSSHRETLESRKRARSLFRTIMFSNWPDLANVRSPFISDSGWSTFKSLVHLPTAPSPSSSSDGTGRSLPPAKHARYTHVIPTNSTFSAYVSLLASLEAWSEIPLAFAWMKALSVAPSWRLMRKALLVVGESAGPKRYLKGRWVRDDEMLREWLEEWFDGIEGRVVPTEEDVAALVRSRSGGRV